MRHPSFSTAPDPTQRRPRILSSAHRSRWVRPRRWGRTLRAKTVLIVTATQLCLLLLLFLPLRTYWLGSFSQLEARMLTTDVQRVRNSITSDIYALDMVNTGYAMWDDTYTFVRDPQQSYIDKNFYDQLFLEQRLNLVLILDPAGRVVFGKAFDLAAKRAVPVPVRFRQLSSNDPLRAPLSLTSSITGVLQLPLAPMLIAAHAITTSEGNGPVRGTLLMGRYLDTAAITDIAARSQLTFTIHRRTDAHPSPDIQASWTAFDQGTPLLIQPLDDRLIVATTLLPDLDRSASLLLRVEMPRSIYAEGNQGITYAMATFVVAGIIFVVLLVVLLEYAVLARLARLSVTVERIGTNGDLSVRVPPSGADEIGRLALTFNRTLAALEGAQRERTSLFTVAQQNAHYYRAILDALPDALYRLSADGRYLDIKPGNADVLPVDKEHVGQQVEAVLSAELAQEMHTGIAQTLATGTMYIVETQYPHHDEMRDIEARFVASGSEEALVMVRDITDRKQAERFKNEFIATVSHELRTPLTAIRGSLGLIAGGITGELSAQALRMIDIAHKNSERLLRLINDLLDIEKIESGTLPLTLQPLDLRAVLAQAVEVNQPFSAQFGVSLRVVEPLPVAWVYADSDRLIQVLSNLFSNAAKFSPRNETVTISSSVHDTTVRIAVTNHGPAIPEAFRSRIFMKFAQADGSTTRQRNGTGLGLSISKAIIERLGGSIGYVSESTTTFYFDLPLYQSAEQPRYQNVQE